MSDPRPGSERPYQTDDEWSRVVFGRRTSEVAGFLTPHLRAGMRLIDCGCGPGSITVDLAEILAQGEAIGIDLRESAVAEARMSGSRWPACISCPIPMPHSTRHSHALSSST